MKGFARFLPPPFVLWFLRPVAVGIAFVTLVEFGPWFIWVLTHPWYQAR